METKDAVSVIGVLTQLALTEAELMWTRYTTMLYANTGLVGILSYSVQQDKRFIICSCAIIGLILSVVWIQIIRLSVYYYQRWQLDADYIVNSDENLKQMICGRINPRLSQPTKWAASKYRMVIPAVFIVGWLFVLSDVIGILSLF